MNIPVSGLKPKLEVRLPKQPKRLLATRHKLHVKVHYKLAREKGNSSTLVSSLTLTPSKHKGRHRNRH